VTSAGTVAVANAMKAFDGGPTGTFALLGSFQNDGTALLAGSAIGNTLTVAKTYAAGPGAAVEIGTLLNAGGPLANQVTDRLLVSGNVTGNSSLVVRAFGEGALTTPNTPSAVHGISLIQVAGSSAVGAFTLPGGYVDGGTPYRYQLYAFGPGSPYGAASATQGVVAGGVNWDYRLENVYVSPIGPEPPEPGPPPPDSRPELAPQIPSYLSLPTALFNAGLQDLDSLHRRLGEIRDDSARGSPEDGEVFIRSYGNAFRYTSNRSFADYGYNSTQDYGAIQFGANAIFKHDLNGTLRGGLFGTFGDLWLQPNAVDGASSGRFNAYSLAGALTWQSGQGWYVDAIVAGGAFYGSVDTPSRGRAANSAGTTMSASIEAGYPLALGWQNLALEPELQLIGQRLLFAPVIDSDGIAVNIGSQSQGVFRAGFRLLKPFTTADSGLLTPYLKVNLLQGIGGGGTVDIAGDPFVTGAYGTAVQVGGGVNGALSRNLSAYGDVAWQDAVSAGGFRGWTFNAGVRYAF
jgi:outer membrane autotransporter protein